MVLFSGGQDSTTCSAPRWRYERVETVGFDYGQNHRVELDCREVILQKITELDPDWAERLGDDHMLDFQPVGNWRHGADRRRRD